jgi:hypothetical protein
VLLNHVDQYLKAKFERHLILIWVIKGRQLFCPLLAADIRDFGPSPTREGPGPFFKGLIPCSEQAKTRSNGIKRASPRTIASRLAPQLERTAPQAIGLSPTPPHQAKTKEC